jgi:hypothetical protein
VVEREGRAGEPGYPGKPGAGRAGGEGGRGGAGGAGEPEGHGGHGGEGGAGAPGKQGIQGIQGKRGLRGPVNHLAVIGYLILAAATTYAIYLNRTDIDKVCTTVQQQLDRNEATLQRSLDEQKLIQLDPEVARRNDVPGADYYASRPAELAAAIKRTAEELKTYQVNAC